MSKLAKPGAIDLRSQIPSLKNLSKELELEKDDLDEALNEIESFTPPVVEQEEPEEAVEEEPKQKQMVLKLLDERADKPSADQMEKWKTKYGPDGVQVTALDRENIYIFTYISGNQWKRVQESLQKLANSPDAMAQEEKIKKAILKTAILWPKISDEWFDSSRAGLAESLYQLILLNSYFLTPQQMIHATVAL